jgi:phage tail protein X
MRRYSKIQIETNSNIKEGVRFYTNVKYPEIPLSVNDIYVITQGKDRYDLLANQYYGDKTLWWVIAIANPSITYGTLTLPEGVQLRIPVNISDILNSYNKLNE